MFHDLVRLYLVFLYLSFFVCGTDGRAADPPAHLLGNCDERAAIIVCFVFLGIYVSLLFGREYSPSPSHESGAPTYEAQISGLVQVRCSRLTDDMPRLVVNRWDKDPDIHHALRVPTSVFSRRTWTCVVGVGEGPSLLAHDCTTQCKLWALVPRRQEAMCHLNTRLACAAGLVGCAEEPRPCPLAR